MVRSVQLSGLRRSGRGRPNLSGDLAQVLSEAPLAFRHQVAGYDRLQVDNYVAWAESELELAGRELEDLTVRLGRCTAQLQQAEQRLATSPAGWELGRLSERVGEILRLAADEAADLVEAGAAEGERFRDQGREAAAAALRQAHDIRAKAVADGDRLHELAESSRRTAEAELQQARVLAAALLHLAGAQHAAATGAHRVAEEERRAAHAELARAQARLAQAEEAVVRLSGELETAMGELSPASAVLAVVPEEPQPPSLGGVDERAVAS